MDHGKAEIRAIIARMQGPNPGIIWESEPLELDIVLEENPGAVGYLLEEFEAMADDDWVKNGLAHYILDKTDYLPAYVYIMSHGRPNFYLLGSLGVSQLRRQGKIPAEDVRAYLREHLRSWRYGNGDHYQQNWPFEKVDDLVDGNPVIAQALVDEFELLAPDDHQKAFLAEVILLYLPYLAAYRYLIGTGRRSSESLEEGYLGVQMLREQGEIP